MNNFMMFWTGAFARTSVEEAKRSALLTHTEDEAAAFRRALKAQHAPQ